MSQRSVALHILNKTLLEESYSNLLMRQELNKLEPIQRKLVTQLVNGCLRNYELLNYQFINEINPNTSLKNKLILVLALYERFFLKQADYVVNNEYVELADNKYDKAFINAVLHKCTKLKKTEVAYIKYSLPEWLYKLLNSQYNENDLIKILKVFHSVPRVYYRLNKTKASYKDFTNITPINEDIFVSKDNLIDTKEYKDGLFYVQDYNSASLYSHLDLKPSMNLLDVCSAPGSKLFNCLDILKPENCYSNDIYEHRVNLIKKAADRLGFKGINYSCIDGLQLYKEFPFKFDRIMLDVPCSGLGVISRKPDLKYHITPNSLDELQELQYNLLQANSKLLKKDGILLYSTCTLNKKENSRNIAKFVSSNDDFVVLEEDTIINEYGDCFYYAKLKKVL